VGIRVFWFDEKLCNEDKYAHFAKVTAGLHFYFARHTARGGTQHFCTASPAFGCRDSEQERRSPGRLASVAGGSSLVATRENGCRRE
jgi:hypothetical protein